jgi:uncharacterized protein
MMKNIKHKILNRIFLLLFILAASSAHALFPPAEGFINDFAGVINAEDEAEMEGIAGVLEKASGIEILVITVKTLEPYGSIEDFALAAAEHYKPGKKGKDNGIVIALAVNERRLRIEVGYGLEGEIPDGLAGEIMDRSMIPWLRENNYSAGLKKGLEAVTGILAEKLELKLEGISLTEAEQYSGGESGLGEIIFFLILFMIFGGGRFFWPLLLLSGITGKRGFFGGGFGSSSGFSGKSSGGFSGGGFGGFSGGGFGGGGASRGF